MPISTIETPHVTATMRDDRVPPVVTDATAADLSAVFHRLNNQLGIVLANAELLEVRLTDQAQRARAVQIVAGTVEAITAVRELRRHLMPEREG